MKPPERLGPVPGGLQSPGRRGATPSQPARLPAPSAKPRHPHGSLEPDPVLYRGLPPESFLESPARAGFGEPRVDSWPADFAMTVGDPISGRRLGTWAGQVLDAALWIGEPHQVAALHLVDREKVLAKVRVYPLRRPVVVLEREGPEGPMYLPYLLEVDSSWTFDRDNLELRDIVAPAVFGAVTLAGAQIPREWVSAIVAVDGFVLEPTAPVHVSGALGADRVVAEFRFRESNRDGHGDAFAAIRAELAAGVAGGAKGRNPNLPDTFEVAMRELALDALDQSQVEAEREQEILAQEDPEREARILEIAEAHAGLQPSVDSDEGLIEAMRGLEMDAAASAPDEALYERGGAIADRWGTFDPERALDEQISEAEGRVRAHRALQDTLASNYVPLRRLDTAAFADADEGARREQLRAVIVETLDGIRLTRGHLATETLDPWAIPILFDATIAALGISDPAALTALESVRERRQDEQEVVKMATLALQVGLAVGGFLTTGPAAALLTLASTSVGAYETLSSLEGYSVRSAATRTDLDPAEALVDPAELDGAVLWLGLDLIGLGFDAVDVLKLLRVARPGTDLFRAELRSLARRSGIPYERAAGIIDQRFVDLAPDVRRALEVHFGISGFVTDPRLENAVEIGFEQVDGRITGLEVWVGPDARAADVLLHAPAYRVMARYRGTFARLWRAIDTVRSLLGGEPAFPVGSLGMSAQRELEKLPGLITFRKGRIDAGDLGADEIAAMEDEIATIEDAIDRHAAFLASGGDERWLVEDQGVIGMPRKSRRGRAQDALDDDSYLRAEVPAQVVVGGQTFVFQTYAQGSPEFERLAAQWAPTTASMIKGRQRRPEGIDRSGLPSGTTVVRVYRTEVMTNRRIGMHGGPLTFHNAPAKSFKGHVGLNFGNEARAREFARAKLEQGLEAVIVSFEVDERVLERLGNIAIDENTRGATTGKVVRVDRRSGPNQFMVPPGGPLEDVVNHHIAGSFRIDTLESQE